MKTVSAIIRAELESGGTMPFARFMELALYAPGAGYYEMKRNPGRAGDFFTNVSTGGLFGQLLAFQFTEWLKDLSVTDGPLNIVEGGAHDGTLARDIMAWIRAHRLKIFERLQYIILEPSPQRQAWQRETLKEFAGKMISIPNFSAIVNRVQGVIFSNELLDAFPVHRLGWDANGRKWFEWGVAWDGDKFVWARMECRRPPAVPPELLDVLPDAYTIEISPAAEAWWMAAANGLDEGKLLTIDYGLTQDERFLPQRQEGTLRAYFRHHPGEILANPGEQDLTAHVNFSAIQSAGEACGLTTENFSTQSQFLTRILEKAATDPSFGNWAARARQFQTLTHPEHLGRAFRILVQTRSNPMGQP